MKKNFIIKHMAGIFSNQPKLEMFCCFLVSATFICLIFSDPLDDATLAPVCVFCPWLKFLMDSHIVCASKTMIAVIAAIYLSIIYLSGACSNQPIYIICLCVHYIGVFFALTSVSIDEVDKNLMIWSLLIVIPISLFYYGVDLFMFKYRFSQEDEI